MSDVIEDEMFSSSVIKKIEVLDFDYIPDKLIHRDDQLRLLAQMFKPILSNIAQNVIVKGSVVTGKTVIAKKFCNRIVQ